MSDQQHWHLVCYDIRDPIRWRKAFKILKGVGEHLQYSIFRVRLTPKHLESLQLRLEKVLDDEDDLLIIRLCDQCANRIIDTTGEAKWKEKPKAFEIF